MKRYLGHVLAGLALMGAGVTIVAACVHNNSSIFVQDVLSPQVVTPGMLCVYTGQTTQAVLSSGVLDVDFLNEYNPTYLVGNQLIPQANPQQLSTETDTVTIEGAVVTIDAGGVQLASFTSLAAATIYPALGGVPSFAPITVTTIDQRTVLSPAVASVVNAGGQVRLVTYVRFFGHTLGNRYVETGDFEFPVDVCKGCLITFSGPDIRAGCAVPNCLNASTASSVIQSPCVPGQDIAVDCSLCQGIPDCRGAPQTTPNCTTGDAG